MSLPTTVKISKSLFLSILCSFSIWVSLECKVTEAQCGDLPDEEKNAFGKFVDELGRKDWITKDPCNNKSWSFAQTEFNNGNATIICNCSYPDGLYHIESIYLQRLDLPGVLLSSLAKLPYLKTVDLNRNYLSGTIPPEWASSKLESLSLSANRFSGPIPKFLGNLTNLTFLSLENNLFNGSIPPELGKLVNLQRLILSANFLTGELPKEFLKLKNLIELAISSNNFTGKLPDFHGWNNLNRLEIMASGLEGPIPSSISALINLTELKISDLKGGASAFPLLDGMKGMKNLMLQSCNLIGHIPSPFPDMPKLARMDLSFNKLEGRIPDLDLANLTKLEILYLTGNSLSGPIPRWITARDPKVNIDLSYNNLSEKSVPPVCMDTSLNLYRSYHGRTTSELIKCLKPCKKVWYSFHVNCGGNAIKIGRTTFDGDDELADAARFVPGENWGMSMTGDFWYRKDRRSSDYIANNLSVLQVKDAELYTTARLSPLSLTYYRRCLANGNYTVTLHFAEIVFRDNQSYLSLGRRLFDVYIQDEQKLKDFNIEHEAGGVDKVNLQTFKNVLVRNRTLEIRFHYSGKGTTDIPTRGTYGPLISAISVKSEFKQPLSYRSKIFIASGASLLALFVILLALLFSYCKGYIGGKISREEVLRGFDLRTGMFTLKQIQAATNNFDAVNKIGEGGFGSVYKGTLLDGTSIAVKQLSSKSKQGAHEFVNELGLISGLQHPNLIKLYGCCVERSDLLLVYEFMENNSLANALFEESRLEIDWPTRQKICLGIANGLAYLHEESTLKIVHRDIKSNNILLDKDLNPKISDFGLAKLDEEEITHISTRVAGSIGYLAPEYALWGHLTYKADVYSFGVVALEIVAGKSNMKYRPNDNCVCLLHWALVLQKQGRLLELVDPRLNSNFDENEAVKILRISLLCTNPSPTLRPTMSEVVSMLQGHISVQEFNMDTDEYSNDWNLQVLRERYHDSPIDLTLTQATTSSFASTEIVKVEGSLC